MKEVLVNALQLLGKAWWVEIVTETPHCTYYFGPFVSAKEANTAKVGYLEDLQNEGAQEIKVVVKRCKPENLTLCDDLGERFDPQSSRFFSGQMS